MDQQAQSSIPDFDIEKSSQLFYRDNLKLCCDSKSLWICYFSGVVVYLFFIGLMINDFYKNASSIIAPGWVMVVWLLVLICIYLLINTLTSAYIIQYTLIKVHNENITTNIFFDTIKKLIKNIDDLIIYSFIRPYYIDLWVFTRTWWGFKTFNDQFGVSNIYDSDICELYKNLIRNLSICFILDENLNSQQAIKHIRSQKNIFLIPMLFQKKTMNRSIGWTLAGFFAFFVYSFIYGEIPTLFPRFCCRMVNYYRCYHWHFLDHYGFIILYAS
jgi:hypothetical protein